MKKQVFIIAGAVALTAAASVVWYAGSFQEAMRTDPVYSTENEKLEIINETGQEGNGQITDFTKYDSFDSKNRGWGFKKNKGMEPDIAAIDKEMMEKYDGYYIDERKPKALYLTFDEGYENGYTEQILNVLKEKGVPAAFFVTGPYLEQQTELVKRMFDEGHIVGNHTIHHPNLAKISAKEVYEEIDGLNKKCEALYGKKMAYVRPPEGEHSEKMMAVIHDMGYKTIYWSFAYKDWDIKSQKGADYAFEQVTPYLHDGAILLLHAVSSDNAAALGRIIDYAKGQGYEFRSLDALARE